MTSDVTTMRATVINEFGPPDVLTAERVPTPEPGEGEVRIRVEAVTVNTNRDVLTRSGGSAFSRFIALPHILGGEHAGWVDAVGGGVDPQLIGRRVGVEAVAFCGECKWCAAGAEEACQNPTLVGIHRQGAYAEYTVVPRSSVVELTDDLPFVDAAVLLTTGPVGFAQVEAAGVRDGDVVIVPGVSGALGSMVAALASSRGARVVGLARDVARAESLPLAATVVLDSHAKDIEARLQEACGSGGATAVIDNICVAPAWDACLGVLAPKGRVVISGTIGPGHAEIDTRRLYLRNQSIIGVRTGNVAQARSFWQLVEEGFRLPPGLVQTSALSAAADVHREIESSAKRGHYALSADSAS